MHTSAGAKAFAEFFIKTIDWGYATTSSAYMRHYFAKSCIDCTSIADALDRNRTKQYRVLGDRFTLKPETKVKLKAGSTAATATVHFDVSAGEVVNTHDAAVRGQPAMSNYGELVTLKSTSDAWTVTFLAVKT